MSSTTTTTTIIANQSLHSNATIPSASTVQGSFNYYSAPEAPDVAQIFSIFAGTSPDLCAVPVSVKDIRSSPQGLQTFTLTTHGFQVLQHASKLLPPQSESIPDFHDSQLMHTAYWPELITMLKSQLGIRAAAAINTTFRQPPEDTSNDSNTDFKSDNPRANPKQNFNPFFVVHGDYTPAGGRAHLRAMLPTFFEDNGNISGTTEAERAEFFKIRNEIILAEKKAMESEGVNNPWDWTGKNYAGPRWAILSVWRPLKTVKRDPLAVMDARSLFSDPERLPYSTLSRMYKDRPGFDEEYRVDNMLPLPPRSDGYGHDWYYISNQRPEEVYALKLFDSEAHKEGSQVAQCVAHSAFALDGQESEKARRSAEVRVMVVW